MEKTYLNFTRERFNRFKEICASCDGDVFTFENKLFLKDYACYLIEYLSTCFPDEVIDANIGTEDS